MFSYTCYKNYDMIPFQDFQDVQQDDFIILKNSLNKLLKILPLAAFFFSFIMMNGILFDFKSKRMQWFNNFCTVIIAKVTIEIKKLISDYSETEQFTKPYL